jgi:hypothetical protein
VYDGCILPNCISGLRLIFLDTEAVQPGYLGLIEFLKWRGPFLSGNQNQKGDPFAGRGGALVLVVLPG